MAYTKIMPIKDRTHLQTSINYIISPEKTSNQVYVEGFYCTPARAEKDFEYIYNMGTKIGCIKAHHIVQSFTPDDKITPEQAMEIGRKLMHRLYPDHQYVLAVHIDNGQVHNHILVNAVNFTDYKKLYATKKSLESLRKISDDLCRENGLEIIPPDSKLQKMRLQASIDAAIERAHTFDEFIGIMKSFYYEVKHDKYYTFKCMEDARFMRMNSLGTAYSEEAIKKRISGEKIRNQSISVYYNKQKRLSNRAKLKDTIRYALKNSNSYDEFLHLLKNEGIEIKTGMHLAMRIPMAKKFIRVERLGTEYSEDMLKLYFANRGEYVRLKNEADQTKIQHLAQNAEYNKYAAVHNINVQIRMMNALSEMGIDGIDELNAKIEELEEQVNDNSRDMEIISERLNDERNYIYAVRNYWRLKPIYAEYKSIKSDADKEIFMLDRQQDVDDYKRVVDTINAVKASGKFKDTASVKVNIKADEQKKAELEEQRKKYKEELQKCRLILENLKSIGLAEEENKIDAEEYTYSSHHDNSR